MLSSPSKRRSIFLIVFAFALLLSALLPAQTTSSNVYSSSANLAVYPAPLVVVPTVSATPTCTTTEICPSMMQSAYGFNSLQASGVTGKDQTIVIVDACGDPSIKTDLAFFDQQFGLPSPTLNVTEIQGTPVASCQGWGTEVALDVEWAHVTAPDAAIDLLITKNAGASAMYAAWSYALSHNLGNQISDSWGGAGCSIKPCVNKIGEGIGACTMTNGTQGVNVANILSTAAKKHVTVLAAAGDLGAWGQGKSNEEPVPGDCPQVLTVGGTTLTVSSTGLYMHEEAWSDGGGGYATAPAEPKFQKNAGISDPYNTAAKPDVAADADPNTGVWVYLDGSWGVIGGTSLATPLWAGFMADVNQIRASNDFTPAGFVNPFLYKTIYENSTLYSRDFHDITTGNNGWPAGVGWDPATGLGSFIAPNLAETLGDNSGA